jgi:NAD(P)H-nitrite reductase large subunit/rubredoxin
MPKDDILSKGAILQRDANTYAITVRLPGGVFDVTTARRIADVAEKFGIPMLKLTGDARLALIGVKEEAIDAVHEALGAKAQAGTQLCQQYVKSCPGNTYCLRGQQDTLGLARQFEERFYPYPRIASKIKIGIAGCFNSCSEPAIKDIGLVGLPKGWVVMLGGSGGLEPAIAEIVARDVKNEDVLELVGKILEYYSEASERPRTRNMRLGQILRIEGKEPLLRACGLSAMGKGDTGKKAAGASKWVCSTCGKVYDPSLGSPESGIAEGTPFEKLPDSWFCPGCGVGREFFHKRG